MIFDEVRERRKSWTDPADAMATLIYCVKMIQLFSGYLKTLTQTAVLSGDYEEARVLTRKAISVVPVQTLEAGTREVGQD